MGMVLVVKLMHSLKSINESLITIIIVVVVITLKIN